MSWNPQAKLAQAVCLPTTEAEVVLLLPFLYRLEESIAAAPTMCSSLYIVGADPLLALVRLAGERGLAKLRPYLKFVHQIPNHDKSNGQPIETIYMFDRSFRAGWAAWRASIPHRVGFSSGAATYFYTSAIHYAWNDGRSELEKNLDLLRGHLRSDIAEWNTRSAPSLLAAAAPKPHPTEPVVMVWLEADSRRRQWPVREVAVLAEKLSQQGVEVWLAGDRAAGPAAASVKSLVPSLLLKNLCADRTPSEWLALLGQVHLLVSTDLTTLYYGVDLDLLVVGLLGNGLPEAGLAPWRRHASVLSVIQRCPACQMESAKRSPKKPHRCVDKIAGDRVYREVRKSLYDLFPLS